MLLKGLQQLRSDKTGVCCARLLNFTNRYSTPKLVADASLFRKHTRLNLVGAGFVDQHPVLYKSSSTRDESTVCKMSPMIISAIIPRSVPNTWCGTIAIQSSI